MAVAKSKYITFPNMTPEQKVRAQRWAKKWGMEPEECLINPKLGIAPQKKKIVARIGQEAYEILTHGSKDGYVDSYAEITEEVRAFFRSEMAKVKADNLPKVRLR